jgi:hypothetical protein
MFLRNVAIYLRIYMALKPRTTALIHILYTELRMNSRWHSSQGTGTVRNIKCGYHSDPNLSSEMFFSLSCFYQEISFLHHEVWVIRFAAVNMRAHLQ